MRCSTGFCAHMFCKDLETPFQERDQSCGFVSLCVSGGRWDERADHRSKRLWEEFPVQDPQWAVACLWRSPVQTGARAHVLYPTEVTLLLVPNSVQHFIFIWFQLPPTTIFGVLQSEGPRSTAVMVSCSCGLQALHVRGDPQRPGDLSGLSGGDGSERTHRFRPGGDPSHRPPALHHGPRGRSVRARLAALCALFGVNRQKNLHSNSDSTTQTNIEDGKLVRRRLNRELIMRSHFTSNGAATSFHFIGHFILRTAPSQTFKPVRMLKSNSAKYLISAPSPACREGCSTVWLTLAVSLRARSSCRMCQVAGFRKDQLTCHQY